jgi:uncharacterized membrane protein YgcG
MYKIFFAILLAMACAMSGSHSGASHHPGTFTTQDSTGGGGDSGGDDGHIHPHP